MKPNLIFSITLLSFAASIGAIPLLSSILATLKELPQGWQWRDALMPASAGRISIPDAFEEQSIVDPTKCIQRCLEHEFKAAGCSTPKHWDCLCRPEGIAPEIRSCVHKHCKDQESEGNLKVQDFRCRKMDSHFTNRDNEGAFLEKEAARRKNNKRPPV